MKIKDMTDDKLRALIRDTLQGKQPQPAPVPTLVDIVNDYISLQFPDCEFCDPRRTCACRSCTWYVYRERFKDALTAEKRRQELVTKALKQWRERCFWQLDDTMAKLNAFDCRRDNDKERGA